MKNIFRITKINNNQQGQVLLFVIVTMTIALALGVGLSLQTISSISSISSSDSSKKSLAAAEGGAERALVLDSASLQSLVDDVAANCTGQLGGTATADGFCQIDFVNPGDSITTKASIKVEDYPGTGVNTLEFVLGANDVREVFLNDYSADTLICWNGASAIYTMFYNSDGESLKYVGCSGGNCDPSWVTNDFITTGITSIPGYASCIDVAAADLPTTPNSTGLRLRSLGDTASDMHLEFGDPLPTQGYKITAVGGVEGADNINRVVSVIKSFEYLPGYFDFSFYSESNLGI